MKKSIIFPLIALALSIVLSSPDTAAQKSQSADVLLGAALHQEEVEGNIEAAIKTYKKLLAEFPGNRPLAGRTWRSRWRRGTRHTPGSHRRLRRRWVLDRGWQVHQRYRLGHG